MTFFSDYFDRLKEFSTASGLNAVVVLAASVALATTPIAFAFLARQTWFKARRGRTEQKPSFSAVVVAVMLVMGIPAILLALMVKSQYFDKDRYEFDPNRVISVLDQGRQFEARNLLDSAYKADEAVREERKRLAEKEKNLTETVKKLDAAMIALSEAATQSPPAAEAALAALDALGKVRQSVGVDAPHEFEELVVKLKNPTPAPMLVAAGPGMVGAGAQVAEPKAPSKYDREIANVPGPQRELAKLLPLDEVPKEWEVGEMGDGHLETFNAENLYEKIDGRAESFVQYDVTGMAYTNYHPKGDDSGEIQLYVFAFSSPLKAFGKYGSEKPQDTETVDIGDEGYAAAGSVSFYRDKYFVQVVSTSDDPKYAAFSDKVARIVSAKIGGEPLPGSAEPETMAEAAPSEPEKTEPAISPAALFKLLPAGPERADPQYVAQDAFGYSFFSDVFLADYKEGDVTWQGFLRPYASPEEAKKVFEKYVETAKADGADLKEIETEGAERMVLSDNIGLFDAVFLKGNSVGGANGATGAEPAEKFAREFVKNLPEKTPSLGGSSAQEKEEAESSSEN